MVANIQKRGKGETEAKLSHSPIHPSAVFICLCAHLPLRCLLSSPHHASSSHRTALKALILCDSALLICFKKNPCVLRNLSFSRISTFGKMCLNHNDDERRKDTEV